MIDLHSHILPGVDDGAADLAASLAMARVAVNNGIQTIVATPHVNSRYRVDAETLAQSVGALNLELAREGIPLAVLSGAEVAFSQLPELDTATLRRLTLGGGGCLLVESPYTPGATRIEDMLFDLEMRALRPLLAHPERSPAFHKDLDRVERLVQRGVMCLVNAASISGGFGKSAQRTALRMISRGLVHGVASDAHDDVHRPPSVAAALQAAEGDLPGIGAHADWLTREAPAAILAGTPLPRRPEPLPQEPAARLRGLSRLIGGRRRG